MRTPHTSCHRGTPIRLILKNREIIEGKFKDRTANFIILMDGQKVRGGSVKSFLILKGKGDNHEHGPTTT
jgi:hypothetical protein